MLILLCLYTCTIAEGRQAFSTFNLDRDDCYIPQMVVEDEPIGDLNEGTDSSDSFNEVEVEPIPTAPTEVHNKNKATINTSSRSSKRARSAASRIAESFDRMVELRSESYSSRSQNKSHSKISYDACLEEMETMGLDVDDHCQLADLLRDELNRVVFMKFSPEDRMIWARRKFV